jgi:hypothetical protein
MHLAGFSDKYFGASLTPLFVADYFLNTANIHFRPFLYQQRQLPETPSIFHQHLNSNIAIMVKVGDSIPSIELTEGNPGGKVNLATELASGPGIIIGVPAAFSKKPLNWTSVSACSAIHIALATFIPLDSFPGELQPTPQHENGRA